MAVALLRFQIDMGGSDYNTFLLEIIALCACQNVRIIGLVIVT